MKAVTSRAETERLQAIIAKAVRHIVEKDYDKALTALTVGRVWASPTEAEPDEEGLTFLGEGPLRRKLKEIGEGKDFGTLTIAPLVAQSILHRLHWRPTGAEPAPVAICCMERWEPGTLIYVEPGCGACELEVERFNADRLLYPRVEHVEP